MIQVILGETRRVVRCGRGVLVVETWHGFICANAGVDASNAPAGTVILLPLDPDASARRLRERLESALGITAGVIISDTFGRPWRRGLTNVALGVSGLSPIVDYRGQVDSHGRPLVATVLAVADELASAASPITSMPLTSSSKARMPLRGRFNKPYVDFIADIIEEVFAIHINDHAYVKVNGFRNIVNYFGGVNVYVPVLMNYSDPAQDFKVYIEKGNQHLDGTEAEGYVRFRQGYDENGVFHNYGDIFRKENQNRFIKAFISSSTFFLSSSP
jgi:LCP family protein required for cell wall assembly